MLVYYVLPLIVIVALVSFACFSGYIFYIHYKFRHIPGPERQRFFFGNVDIFKKIIQERSITLPETVYELHKQYGPVIILFSLHIHFISVIDPKAAKDLLMNLDYLKPYISYKAFYKVFGQRFLGYGLISELNNQNWARHRKIFNPAFHRKYLMELMDVFNDGADRLTEYLSLKADGETEVNLMAAFERVTLDIIGKAGFAMEEDMISQDTPFTGAIGMAFEAMAKDSQNIFFSLNPLPSAHNYRKNARKAIKLLRSTGEDIIRRRIEDQKQGKALPKDILSYIVKAAMIEENFSMIEMVDEFMTFFGAGQETTSNLLSFTLICLGRHPAVLDKVLHELDAVVGQKPFIEYEDLVKLEYLMLVLKESLRLYPPVFGTGRDLNHTMKISGYDIPSGASVFFCNYAMNRSEDYFKDPLTFDPERFRREEDRPLYVYFPFSIGPRSCIGQQFALIEARVVIAKLLQKLSFRLVPGQNLGVKERLTLKPAGDCLNYITHRTT